MKTLFLAICLSSAACYSPANQREIDTLLRQSNERDLEIQALEARQANLAAFRCDEQHKLSPAELKEIFAPNKMGP